MRRTWLCAPALAFASVLASGGAAQARPNNDCAGFTSLDDPAPVAAHYRPKYDTLTHRLLDLEKVTGHVKPEMYALLDAVIDRARAHLEPYPKNPTPEESLAYARKALPIVHCTLAASGFTTGGSGNVPLLSDMLQLTHFPSTIGFEGDAVGMLVTAHKSWDFHDTDCDTGALLYMAVAETMGWPLSFVTIPGHAFVRWTADPTHRFDFETTDGGEMPAGAGGDIDAHYVGLFHLTKDQLADMFVFQDMSRGDVMAQHHLIVAGTLRSLEAHEKHPDYTPSLREFERAIHDRPDWAAPYNALAWHYAVMAPDPAMRMTALRYALKAVALRKASDTSDTLACTWAALGDFDKAIATEPDPSGPLDDLTPEDRETVRADWKVIHEHKRCAVDANYYDVDGAVYTPPH